MEISEKEKAVLKNYLSNASLFDAVEENNADAVKLLLGLGIDANCIESGKYGDRERPIHHAAYYRNAEVLQVLLENDARPEIKNSDGLSAYDIALDVDDDEVSVLMKSYRDGKRRSIM